MPTAKDEVREMLDQLPDDSSLDDIQYPQPRKNYPF